MRVLLRVGVLGALLFSACAGYVGWYWWYPYPCYDYDCYDYYYDGWKPYSLAVADFDEDGSLDLAVADAEDGTTWYVEGQPGGGFAPVPTSPIVLPFGPAQVASVSADGDGNPDLLVLDGIPGTLSTYAGDGHGGFTLLAAGPLLRASHAGATRFARGAIDQDPFDDVAVLSVDGTLHVELGTGDGGLHVVAGSDPAESFLGPDAAARLPGIHLALSDFDATPGTDLLVVDGELETLAVFSGHRDGTFGAPRVVTFRSLGDVLAVAPVALGEGLPSDVAVLFGDPADGASPSTLAVVRLSDGAFAVDPLSVGTVRSLTARDLDGDGRTDLLLVDPVTREIRALRGGR